MKTLELLKEEYAILFCQYPSWEELLNDIPSHEVEKHTDEIAKLYAKEVAQEALRNASDNATLNKETQYTGGLGITGLLYEESLVIDKQSILNESNIPEL